MSTTSDYVHKYFLTVVEEYIRFIYVCPLRSKAEALEILLRFDKRFERKDGHKGTAVHKDGGREFRNARDHLESQGVDIAIATSCTPNVPRTHPMDWPNVRTVLW